MQKFPTLTRAPKSKSKYMSTPNLFDLTEIATRCGITDKICAQIVLGQISHKMKASVNAMIVGTTHRRQLETEATAALK